MNAFAYNPKVGLVDMFGGKEDLNNKIIRCVGDPDKRFNEDGLRIMRGLRFASCLGFSVDQDTSRSIYANKNLLKNISAERIYSELKKLVCGKNASLIIPQYIDVFSVLSSCISDNFDVILSNSQKINQLPIDPVVRISALLYGVETYNVKTFMNEMKADNYAKDFVANLNQLSCQSIECNLTSVRKLMKYWDDEFIIALTDIKRVFCDDFNYNEFNECYNLQKSLNSCVRLSQLAVTGVDIISMGIPKGPMIGKIMNDVLDAIIEDRCDNNYESIKAYVSRNLPTPQ